MSVWVGASATALTIAALGAIASERMRAYHLAAGSLRARVVAAGIVATAISLWVAWRGIGGIETSIVLGVATISAITDLQCGYLFDPVSFAGGAELIVVAAARGHAPAAVAGGAVAASLLALPWALSRARGIGFADVKLAGVLGLGLGPYDAMRTLWLAFVAGGLVAIACIATRRLSRRDALPFAPFLAIGAIVSASSVW